MNPIYLDYLSTTPVDPVVVEAMQTCFMTSGDFGNPSSQHVYGIAARNRVETARAQVASLIHADPKEIIWTSGATESINLALKGAAQFYQRQGKHIITMRTEHKAALDTCSYLASLGFDVTYLSPQKNGLLDLVELRDAIRHDTILASIMHVNNETGVIQDIAAIGAILREKGVWFHVDAAQSVGKLSLDLRALPVDLMSLASHKIYGPKGVGALFVRRHPRVQLIPQLHGGDQENGLRSGTLPTHQIVGMGMAYAIAEKNREEEMQRITALRDRFEEKLALIPGVAFNGDRQHRIGNCSNFSIDAVDGQRLLKSLGMLAISQGSACNAVDPEPSHVLTAMGLSREEANRSFRFSMGRFTTEGEVDLAVQLLSQCLSRMK